MSSYIATIAFTGICYLVNIKDSGNLKRVSIVMPNGENGMTATGGAIVSPHYAFILYLKNQAMTNVPNREPDLTFVDKNQNVMAVIHVRGERLSFDSIDKSLLTAQAVTDTTDPTTNPLPNCPSNCTIEPLAKSLDQKTFNVLQPYGKIVQRESVCPSPSCYDITASALDAFQSSQISARLDLTGGFLAAGAIKDGTWDFPQGNPNLHFDDQLLPQMAVLEMQTNDSNILTITSQPLDPKETPPLPLKLQGSKDARILVIIGNAPLSDITAFAGHSDESEDHHFELYYDHGLIAQYATGHPYPIKHHVKANNNQAKKDKPTDNMHDEINRWIHLGDCPPMQQGPN